MALLLQIESSSTVCSVALTRDENIIGCKEVNEGYSHAENLTWFIEQLFKENAIHIKSIGAVVVSKGPGSYTGLRIGVSVAKGICFAIDKPLIAINTLQSMAHQAAKNINDTKGLYLAMQDARRMEVYCAGYDINGKEIITTNALIVDEHTTSTIKWDGPVYFFGDGAQKCSEHLKKDSRFIFAEGILPSSKSLTTLACKAFEKKQFENIIYFEPYYLKEFVSGKK